VFFPIRSVGSENLSIFTVAAVGVVVAVDLVLSYFPVVSILPLGLLFFVFDWVFLWERTEEISEWEHGMIDC